MSVVSGFTKFSSGSILRKTPTFKSAIYFERTPTKVRFVLPHSKNVKQILQKFALKTNIKDYEQLVYLIIHSELFDEDVCSLLSEATQCISLLTQDLRLFVEAILLIKWVNYSERVISEYQSFLINLLSAHNYYTKFAIDQLVYNFLPGPDEPIWPDGNPTEQDCKVSLNVHFVIHGLIGVVPMCRDLLLQALISQYPYLMKSAHTHELYLHNLLLILNYQPSFRPEILHLIFSKLVLLDVHAPKEEIIKSESSTCMDVDGVFPLEDSGNQMQHSVANSLDVCLDKVFKYLIVECYDMDKGVLNWDRTKNIYQDIIVIFDKVLLPTYNIHHVQFVMFLLCSFKTSLTEAFISYLWKKVCSANVPSVHRQTAVAYMASLIARSTFVTLSIMKQTLQQMSHWIHAYIITQDGLECVNSDIRVHTVFYSVCQGLFYIIAFRYRELVNTRKNITLIESLSLPKIITSRLNPLRFCQPAVVHNFASITRMYQLAYCYSIIEHNCRNTLTTIYQDEKGATVMSNNILDSFFPFDPYILKRSAQKIAPNYLEYHLRSDGSFEETETVDMDDFLPYGTSPGFRK